MIYPFQFRRMTDADALTICRLWQPDPFLLICEGALKTNAPLQGSEYFAAVRGKEVCGQLTLIYRGDVVTYEMSLAPDQTGRATAEAFLRACIDFLSEKFPDARLTLSNAKA